MYNIRSLRVLGVSLGHSFICMFLGHTEALINRELARWYGIRVSATYGRGLQVFSATDEDGVPILCLVVKEYQRLSAFRLCRRKISEELSCHGSLDIYGVVT